MADQLGQQLGNYRLLRLLGQGGFADVYLGQHIHLDSQAAIKVLQVRLTGSALEQFRGEGRALASLLHPNIVRVFDFGVENDTPFLVMDFAPNGSLRQHYPKGTMLSPATILPHLTQVARALQYAHDRKLIHRDVKPENMLLGPTNEVLLSDFGLVLHAQSTASQTTKEMAGTLPYMAPEQINGKPRPASDQYALGIVLYEWLSGDRPFHGSLIEIATQHLMTPPAPLYGKVPGMTRAVQEVVFTALAKDFQQRFANMEAFATAFEQACRAAPHSSFSLASGSDSSQYTPLPPSASSVGLQGQSQQLPSLETVIGESQQPTYMHPLVSQSQQSTLITTPSNTPQPGSLNPPAGSSQEPTRTPTSSQLWPQFSLVFPVNPPRVVGTSSGQPLVQSPADASGRSQALPEVVAPAKGWSSAPTDPVPVTSPSQALQSKDVVTPVNQPSRPNALVEQTAAPFADPNPSLARSTDEIAPPIMTRVDAHQKARPRLRLAIALLLCALLLISTGVGYAILRHVHLPGGPVAPSSPTVTITPKSVATSSTTITITPKSIDLKKSYTISAVTGTPDTSQHQVAARSLSSITQAYTKTVNATGTGTTPATTATGTLTFQIVCCIGGSLVVPAGVTWTGKDGTQVVNDQSLCLNSPAAGSNTATVSAHSILAGSSYNIGAGDIFTGIDSYLQASTCPNTQGISGSKQLVDKVEQCGCSSNRTPGTVSHSPALPFGGGGNAVYNSSAFTGGQNSQTYTFVRQSDIDGAASSLETANMPNAQQVLQPQIHANERLIGSPHCQPNVTHDHAVGDVANTVTVSVTFTCIGEVYDQQGALVAAEQWLKQDAVQNPGAGYVLVGNVVTMQTDAQIPDPTQGTIAIAVSAEGVWVYHFNDAQQRTLAKLVAGKTRGIAQSLLSEQQGIASIDIQLPVADHDTLPTDPSLIKLIVLNVQGKSS